MDAIQQARELERLRRMIVSGQARKIRQRARISQEDLGRQLGVRESTLWRWETGRSLPRPKVARRWLAALDELAEITSDDDDQEVPAAASA